MIPRKIFILFITIALFSCHQNDRGNSGIIFIDANMKYPELELKLSDIADISYIPLQSNDNIFGYLSANRALFVYGDKIFIGDMTLSDPKLLVYDHTGTHLKTFGSYGRGPGEYISLRRFVVDTLTNEVTIYDFSQRKIIVYSIEGKFKREKSIGEISREQRQQFTAIDIINDTCLLLYNYSSFSILSEDLAFLKKGQELLTGKTLMILDKQTLSEVPFQSFEYAQPKDFNTSTLHCNLTTTKEGVYITSERSDTIYFVNRNLEIIPKFRDVTDYGNQHIARLFPAIETERYTFFSTELGIRQGLVKVDNPIEKKFFAYDKKLQKLFRLNNGLSGKYTSEEKDIALLNNLPAFDEFTLTLNHNYAYSLLIPEFLLKRYNNLPDELKAITKNLKEDDNPVVMLIKFK